MPNRRPRRREITPSGEPSYRLLGISAHLHEADHPRMSAEVEAVPVETEEERVFEWRLEELFRGGFSDVLAVELAAARDVDLHEALDLVARGCPPDTAARILL